MTTRGFAGARQDPPQGGTACGPDFGCTIQALLAYHSGLLRFGIGSAFLPRGDGMAGAILAAVEDLIFLSKIHETAKLTGVRVEAVDPKTLRERAGESAARAVILDLNHRSGVALETLRALKSDPRTRSIYVLGFVSHVETDLAARARAAGCDQVLARSTFSAQLPQILEKLSGAGTAAEAASEDPAPPNP